jgi:hypothetical protein
MKHDTFAPGILVQYKDYMGRIDFLGEEYFTLCLDDRSTSPVNHVCILVYKQYWNEVTLMKQSSK